uniref:D-3-phosphoglycerate dehydrogenase n=1 Tax=Schistocephalus solidus TaxID=70667 RepID=A0A0V0J9H5_SCHSO
MTTADMSKKAMTLLPSISRVLVLDGVAESAVIKLRQAGVEVRVGPSGLSAADLVNIITDYTPAAVIVRSATKLPAAVIESVAFCVRVIARAGVGVDNIDIEAARQQGILVINAPLGNTVSAAEHTCALLLSLARQLPLGQVRTGADCGLATAWNVSKKATSPGHEHCITEIAGKTIGLVGLGKIGAAVGVRMHAFGARIIGYDPAWSLEGDNGQLPTWLSGTCSLEELWPQADYISLHVPLTPSTHHLIGTDVLSKCKPGVRIINCSRGGVVDEMALLESLKSGHCAAAALDLLEQEPPGGKASESAAQLATLPNVILTPHLGASSCEAQVRVAEEVVESILAIGSGQASRTGLENAMNLSPLGSQVRDLLADAHSRELLLDSYGSLSELVFVASFANLQGCLADDAVAAFDSTIYVDVPSVMSNVLMTSLTHLLCILLSRNKCSPSDCLSSLILPTVGSEKESLQLEPLSEFKAAGPSFVDFLKEKSLHCLAALRLSFTMAKGKNVSGVYGLLEAANAADVREVYRLAVDSQDALTPPQNLGGIARLGEVICDCLV